MSQDGLAYSARAAALTEPSDWPAGSDWDTIATNLTGWPTGWSHSVVDWYTDSNLNNEVTKTGSAGGTSVVSQAAAQNDAWSTHLALSAAAGDGGPHPRLSVSYGKGGSTYSCAVYVDVRSWYTFTPPAGTVSVFLYFYGWTSSYYGAVATGTATPLPPWRVGVYQSTTAPAGGGAGIIGATDWAYGTKVATMTVDMTTALGLSNEDTSTLSEAVELSAFTANVTNYMQLRMGNDEPPSFLQTLTWGTGRYMEQQGNANNLSPGTDPGVPILVYHDGT